MKTIVISDERGFPEFFTIIFFLSLIITSLGLAAHSLAIAQSSQGNPNDSKEEKDAKQPESKKVKLLGPADEFDRGVPRQN